MKNSVNVPMISPNSWKRNFGLIQNLQQDFCLR